MPKFSTPSRYLKYSDLVDEHDTIFTIASYAQEEIGQRKEKRWVVYFHETDLGLVLNATNGKAVTKACGTDEMDDWKGKPISLYIKDDVEFQGDIVSAIRVRVKAPGLDKAL